MNNIDETQPQLDLTAQELGDESAAEMMAQEVNEVPIEQENIEEADASPVDAAVTDEGLANSELAEFESAEIEEEEFIPLEQMESIVESMLFASDRPVSLQSIKEVFKGTSISTRQIRKALEALAIEYASAHRGVTLETVAGGYQLKTKVDNMDYLRRMVKARPFKLSGPAMEVLSIVAYQQPMVKAGIDEIRGVESGHLLRALMEKGIVSFAGKSDLPGKPMLYATTRKFLEIFSLKSLKELPTLAEIDELLPEGIGEEEGEKQTLSDVTDELSEEVTASSYSDGENELLKITDQLADIDTSSEFFEQEKRLQREKRDRDRAQDLQEALSVGEEISTKDERWLQRYLTASEEAAAAVEAEAEAIESASSVENEVAERTTEESADENMVQAATENAPEDNVEGVAEVVELAIDQDTPDMDLVVNEEDDLAQMEAAAAIKAFDEDDAEGIIAVDEPIVDR